MKRNILLMAMLSILMLHNVAEAFDRPAPSVTTAARDATGRVWGNMRGTILGWWDASIRDWRGLHYTGDVLVEVRESVSTDYSGSGSSEDDGPNALYEVVALQSGATGVVCCLWAARKDQPLVVTRHIGEKSRIVGQFMYDTQHGDIRHTSDRLSLNRIMCYMDSKENIWMNPDLGSIYKMDCDGLMEKMYDLPVVIQKAGEEQLQESGSITPQYTVQIQINAIEDTLGRVIFYKEGKLSKFFTRPGIPSMTPMLDGIFIYDQGIFNHIKKLTYKDSTPFCVETSSQAPIDILRLEMR